MSDVPSDKMLAITITACTGHICLQWARLEMALLRVIYALEDCPIKKGEIIYGNLDMLPRVNMAIKLADYHKAPASLRSTLRDIRKQLQDRLSEERNRAVHGVQKPSDTGQSRVTFTMVRFRGEKRDKELSPEDLQKTALDLLEQGDRAWLVFENIGTWKFGSSVSKDTEENADEHAPGSGFKFAREIHGRIKQAWRGMI